MSLLADGIRVERDHQLLAADCTAAGAGVTLPAAPASPPSAPSPPAAIGGASRDDVDGLASCVARLKTRCSSDSVVEVVATIDTLHGRTIDVFDVLKPTFPRVAFHVLPVTGR